MGMIIPGTALSLQWLVPGSGPNPGTFLDGRTASAPPVGLAADTFEPFTGTRWLARSIPPAPPNQVTLECLGDINGPRFLNGRTEDGIVDLAPSTAPSGTIWEVRDAGADEVFLVCLGTSTAGENVHFLGGDAGRGTVGLFGHGLPWKIVDAQPSPQTVNGVTAATSHFGPSLLFTAYGVGGNPVISMAWQDLNGRVSVMGDVLGPAQTVSLGHRCLDRPALALDGSTQRIYLAWTGTDGSINVMSSGDGLVYGGRSTIPGSSKFGPAINIFRGQPVVAWIDAGTGALMMINGLGVTGTPHNTQETSSAAPALASERFIDGTDALIVAWTGTNAERQLNVMNSQNGFPPSIKVTLPTDGPAAATSISGPSLDFKAAFGGGSLLVMGWTGLPGGPDHDHHLNIIFSGDNFRDFNGRRTVAPVSDAGLAIARASRDTDANMVCAWVDRQNRINVGFSNDLPAIPA